MNDTRTTSPSPTTKRRRYFAFDKIEERTRKDDEGDACRQHADECRDCIGQEFDFRQAEGVIKEIKREDRDEPGECDDLPSMLFDSLIELFPSRALQLSSRPSPLRYSGK